MSTSPTGSHTGRRARAAHRRPLDAGPRRHADLPARARRRCCSSTRPTSSSPSGSGRRSTASTWRTAHYLVDPGRPRRHALRRAQAHRPRRRRAGDDPARVLLLRRRAARLHRRRERATASPPPRSRPSSTGSATRSRSATSSSSTPARAPTTPRSATRPTTRGMTAEATRWLIARGVRMMGIDAITFDPPVWAMFERKQFWEAHRVMWDEEYWHLENLMNLEQIGRPYGFQLCVLPVKWVGTTARAGARGRDRGGLSGARCASTSERCTDVARRRRQGRVAGAHDRARACRCRPASSCPPTRSRPALADTAAAIRAVLARGEAGEDLAAVADEAQALVRAADSGGAFPREVAEAYARARRRRPASRCARARRPRTPRRRASPASRRPTCTCAASTRSSSGSATAGLVLHRARALLPRARRARSSDLGMAVVVQRMVDADVAGVLFTIDPTAAAATAWSSRPCFGLGEGVVSGQLTPDHYVLARDGRRQAHAAARRSRYAIVARPGGRDREASCRPRRASAADARRGAARAAGAVGDDLEERLGGPQDIEWAIEDGELFVLRRGR